MPETEAILRKASRKREALEGLGEMAVAVKLDLRERESGCISDSEVRVNTFCQSLLAAKWPDCKI